jgi:uncharacterized membrane protein YfcA
MVWLTAIALGVMIGGALGLLGGGGSILTVPIFVYVLGFPPKDAIAMSLAVVGATSAVGAWEHWRGGHVNVRVGLLFGLVAMLGTYGGTRLATRLSGGAQLVIFAGVMAVAAVFMSRPRPPEAVRVVPSGARAWLQMLAEAAFVGTLTGLVGVGGGFLIVPALVLAAIPMSEAVGTSLLVITMNSAVGLYGYVEHVTMSWQAVALVIAGTLPGITLGTSLHHVVPQPTLRRAFAALLVIVAAFILYQHLR